MFSFFAQGITLGQYSIFIFKQFTESTNFSTFLNVISLVVISVGVEERDTHTWGAGAGEVNEMK